MSEIASLVERLNPLCRTALERAASLCVSQTNFNVELEHLLIKLLEEPESDLKVILRHFEVDADALERQLTQSVDGLKRGNSRTPSLSPQVMELLRDSWTVASLEMGEDQVRSGALLMALLASDRLRGALIDAAPLLLKVHREQLRENLKEFANFSAEGGGSPAPARAAAGSTPETASTHESAAGPRPVGKTKTPALDAYTIDLTAEARAGRIDPITGRDMEIRQVIDILLRRRQNNPILTGEAGVGKTAVVEGLALRIVEEDVPPPLKAVSIRTLDLGLLQAGAGMKGEFENRLKSVIKEVQSSPHPVILFIDEAHTLIGSGGQAGQNDAANLLKPALARGELRTIAATTWSEYKKHFEKDPALTRRFQVVQVAEPSEEAAVEMLRALAPKLERHHGVRILDEAVREAVRLSHRYLAGRQLPDKAVSVLDTACARAALAQHATPPQVEAATRRAEALQREIAALERETATGRGDPDQLDELQTALAQAEDSRQTLEGRWRLELEAVKKVHELEAKIEEALAAGKTQAQLVDLQSDLASARLELETIQDADPMIYPCADAGVVASVISGWTGIPVGRMLSDEIRTILGIRERMAERIVGQPLALDAISRRIRTFRANLDEPGKPAGVFLLVGPSGVGKTETALTLADLLYGGERKIITVNMSEYQEAHSVSSLKGAPPGYVGYGKGGVLTEAVRRNPYSVVLLDEIEKAHPDVMELFYQVFDKGTLEDGEGITVDFKNTVILLTSNVASDRIIDLRRRHGDALEAEMLIEDIRPELTRVFKPAFLGRLVVVPYMPLGEQQISAIIRLKLDRIQKRFEKNHNATLSYDASLIAAIAQRCNEVETGARTIDNLLTNSLLPELSGQVLEHMMRDEPFHGVHISTDAEGTLTYEVFTQQQPRARQGSHQNALAT